jgi:hypothetical protein
LLGSCIRMLLRACTFGPYRQQAPSKMAPSGWISVVFYMAQMGEVKAPLGLPVVHHNDRKLILLASLFNYFSPYNWVTVSFTDFTKSHPAFQDLALLLGSFNNILRVGCISTTEGIFNNSINSLIKRSLFSCTYDFIFSIYSLIFFSPSKVQK